MAVVMLHDNNQTLRQAFFRNRAAGQGCELFFDFIFDIFGKRGVCRDKNARAGVMLACASKSAATHSARAVSSAMTSASDCPAGMSMAAPAGSCDKLLGRRHINIAGPENFIDFRHRLRAIGHSPDSLCPAHGEDIGNAAKLRGSKNGRMNFPVALWRRTQNDIPASPEVRGGDRLHQQGRKQRRGSRRDI